MQTKTPFSSAQIELSLRRALIVDDFPDITQTLDLALKALGWSTQIAIDGMDALRKANTFKPHLVFLDILMPKLDGFDACTVIRAQPWAQNVRIVAITGQQGVELHKRAKNAGFDALLFKPFNFLELKTIAKE